VRSDPDGDANVGLTTGGATMASSPSMERWDDVRLGILLLPLTVLWAVMVIEERRRASWRRLSEALRRAELDQRWRATAAPPADDTRDGVARR
jgi:hypothetical protein